MRRKIKPIDLNDLFDANDINRTTIKGEMRKLWPAINKKLIGGGWTARDMVNWLSERGICMSVELFRVYLNDLDREQGFTRSKNKFHSQNSTRIASQGPGSPKSTPTLPPLRSQTVRGHDPPSLVAAEAALQRPPGITNAMWAEMQQKHKAALRRQRNLGKGESN